MSRRDIRAASGGTLAICLAVAAAGCATVPSAIRPAALPTGLAEIRGEASGQGIWLSRFERGGDRPLVIHVARLDLTRPGLRIETTPGDPSRESEFLARLTSAALAETGATLAVNASYFLPFRGGRKDGEDYYPHVGDPVWASGAVIADGGAVSPAETALDIRVNATVCMNGARLVIVARQVCPRWTLDGVAAGPLLLMNGRIQDFSRHDADYAASLAPRSAIGVSRDRRTAWIVVVDGRQAGYSLGVDLMELTQVFSALGAWDAINLDGGGSSTLAHRDDAAGVQILNRPIHTATPGRERPVANHILIFAD